ncbi:MAG: PfkB family carbohydrate kinase [Deltaproteobacteria bacterium]|nr:PfkB family carbohydrate kinase [Deltaproteobacteria bacterium]MDL1960873.1 PfkB family carbohydrate kinase [Deltaproteobacteria bacterium]
MIDFLGSGALNLDLVYEVDDLEDVRSAGFDLYPGREISGDHETAKALIDFLRSRGTLMAKSGGGSSANTICALSRLGHKVGFVGVAGEDEAGSFILSSMEGVDLSLVKQVGRSAICIIIVEKVERDRAMFVVPHDQEVDFLDFAVLKSVSNTRVLHFSSLVRSRGISIQKELANALKPEQILSFDPGELYATRGIKALSGILKRTDLLFVTEEEVKIMTGMAGKAGLEAIYPLLGRNGSVGLNLFKDTGGTAIICKQGPKGATICSPGMSLTIPAEKVLEVVDNTGAGDAFNAGFLNAMLQGAPAHECLRSGVRLAALSLSAFGRGWLARL